MNLHKRLQQNPLTSRHCYGLSTKIFLLIKTKVKNLNFRY